MGCYYVCTGRRGYRDTVSYVMGTLGVDGYGLD